MFSPSSMELAMCYFLLDGEDETDIDKSANQRKMEIWSTDDDARGFFLEKSFQSTIQFSNMLESDIPDYLGKILKEQNREGQKLSHILHQLKRGNTLMK